MLLEDVLRLHLPRLYEGYEIESTHAIRVTRDSDVQLPRGRTQDLMAAIEASLRERRMGDAVRLQYDPNLPPDVLATLVNELELTTTDLYEEQGFAAFADLLQLYAALDRPRLKDRSLVPLPGGGLRPGLGRLECHPSPATSSSIIPTTRSTWSRDSSRTPRPIRTCSPSR